MQSATRCHRERNVRVYQDFRCECCRSAALAKPHCRSFSIVQWIDMEELSRKEFHDLACFRMNRMPHCIGGHWTVSIGIHYSTHLFSCIYCMKLLHSRKLRFIESEPLHLPEVLASPAASELAYSTCIGKSPESRRWYDFFRPSVPQSLLFLSLNYRDLRITSSNYKVGRHQKLISTQYFPRGGAFFKASSRSIF